MGYWVLECKGDESTKVEIHSEDCAICSGYTSAGIWHGRFVTRELAISYAKKLGGELEICEHCLKQIKDDKPEGKSEPVLLKDAVFAEYAIAAKRFADTHLDYTFWIFESESTDEFSTIHKSNCQLCNDGKFHGDVEGIWHGDFSSYDTAEKYIKNSLNSNLYNCRICKPQIIEMPLDNFDSNAPIITKAVLRKGKLSSSSENDSTEKLHEESEIDEVIVNDEVIVEKKEVDEFSVESDNTSDNNAKVPVENKSGFCVCERKSLHYSATIHRQLCSHIYENSSDFENLPADSARVINAQKVTLHEGFTTFAQAKNFVESLPGCEIRNCRHCEPSRDVVSINSSAPSNEKPRTIKPPSQATLKRLLFIAGSVAAVVLVVTFISKGFTSTKQKELAKPGDEILAPDVISPSQKQTTAMTQIPSSSKSQEIITDALNTESAVSTPSEITAPKTTSATESPEPTISSSPSPSATPTPSPTEPPIEENSASQTFKIGISENRIRLRASANLRSSTIAVLQPNSKAIIISEDGKWMQVFGNGKFGFVYSEYIKVTQDTVETGMPDRVADATGKIQKITDEKITLKGKHAIDLAEDVIVKQLDEVGVKVVDSPSQISGKNAMIWTDEQERIHYILAY